MITPQQLLTRGLQQGFAGKTKLQTVSRGGFSVTASHFTESTAASPAGTKKAAEQQHSKALYHDEWAADRSGGGQELARVGDQIYTRVYAGGTLPEATLEELGTTKAQIMKFLIAQLAKLGEKTRLETDCGPLREGDWEYAYRVTEKNDDISYTCGKEEIRYQGHLVFVHHFVMCAVE
jgi:hypothetical protein